MCLSKERSKHFTTIIFCAGASGFPVIVTSYIEIGSGPIHMSFVQCRGTESKLVNCPYSDNFYDIFIFCDHYYDAAVRCQRGTEIDSVVEYSK